jgi:hypothetical protein
VGRGRSKLTSKKPVVPVQKPDVSQLTAHSCADIYPLLNDEEMEALADDIKENGLIHPIIVQGNVIIDGRNRLAACKLAGVEPVFKEFDGNEESIKGYILGANNNRRHLNGGQRAMAYAIIYPDPKKGRPKGAELMYQNDTLNVRRNSLSNARLILKWAPDQVALVMSGEVNLSAAYEIAKAAESDHLKADGDLINDPVAEKVHKQPKPKIQAPRLLLKRWADSAEKFQSQQGLESLVTAVNDDPAILDDMQRIRKFISALYSALNQREPGLGST